MSVCRLALSVLPSLLALAPAARAQVVYSVSELLPPPGSQYVYGVNAVNNVGQSAGLGTTANPLLPPTAAVRTTPGIASQNLGFPPGYQPVSFAFSLNNNGQVAGYLQISNNQHAARYTDGSGWLDLGTFSGDTESRGAGINNVGQVTGWSGTSTTQVPFRYTDGAGMQSLGLPPGTANALGVAINSRGQVAVNAAVTGTNHPAFRYTDGVGYQNIGSLGGTFTTANAINDAGQVVGSSRDAAGVTRPFLYTDGLGMMDLGTLPGGTGGTAEAINAIGILTGSVNMSGGAHAFIYDGVMRDLNSLIGPSSGWVLMNANGISDTGFIVGTGTFNGQQASFLLTPVPEPSSFALMAAGAGALYVRLRRRPA